MNEIALEDGDVQVRRQGALRRLTLNRPKAFNALTVGMAESMTRQMHAWAAEPAVGAVLIDGAGDRGLCAGGDLRALYDGAKAQNALPERFWATEYRLNVLIARYPKPVIAVMDGLVMGGGVGISAHAAHRVVTDRSAVAMPEVGIGFFPDVGVSFLLARAPGAVGAYLALTGNRINAADAIYCGLADTYVRAADLAALPPALGACRNATEVRACLDRLGVVPAPGRLAAARSWIDRCFAADRIEDNIARLAENREPEAATALDAMRKASPTSLKVTLRNLRDAAAFRRVETCFQQDYRIALACIAGHDFIEGIRATIVDKDRKPAWRPDRIEAVTQDIVDRHFQSVGALELQFAD